MREQLRILVVDDDRRMANTLVDILRAKGYAAEAAYSGPEALDKVNAAAKEGATPFASVLTDIKMPDMNGVELYRAIRAAHPGVPVVLMTAYAANGVIGEGLEQGAVAALIKPLDINLLLSFFAALRKECTIVIVDDDPAFRKTMGDILGARGFAVSQVTDPHGWEDSIKPNLQVVLLDMKLNDVDGLEILREIRLKYPHLPVILVTGCRAEMASAIDAALEINAYTCLYKPLEIEELLQLLADLHHQNLGRMLGQRGRKRR